MKNKGTVLKWWLLVVVQLVVIIVVAQPPGGGGGGGGVADAPIDGGAVGLLAAIAGYGYRSLKRKENILEK